MAGWPMAAILGGARAPLVPLADGDGYAYAETGARGCPGGPGSGPFQVIAIPEGGRGAQAFARCGGWKADYAQACLVGGVGGARDVPSRASVGRDAGRVAQDGRSHEIGPRGQWRA
jgi:hypothetical protein